MNEVEASPPARPRWAWLYHVAWGKVSQEAKITAY